MTSKELTEEQQRVHGYLVSQGEKYSWLELWQRVMPARLQLLDTLDGVTDQQANSLTSADDWTIVGEPREVQEKILEYQERLGMTHLIASRGRLGSLTAEEIETSIALLAEVVLHI